MVYSSKKIALVCLKSFGDAVIAAQAIQMLVEEDAKNITLLIGSHHLELFKALQPSCKIEVVSLKYKGVPAFYDIKEKGVIRAALSLLDARVKLSKYQAIFDEFMFDTFAFRERMLARGIKASDLNKNGNNIYRNYHNTFLQIFGRIKNVEIKAGPSKNILIFPHGRKLFRNIPSEIIDSLSERCLLSGFTPIVRSLNTDIPITSNVPHTVVEEPSFLKMREAIEGACAIISADSLAAHFATYLSRPVFVVSPYRKTLYWLPTHSDQNQYWGLFFDKYQMIDAFDKFLANLGGLISRND